MIFVVKKKSIMNLSLIFFIDFSVDGFIGCFYNSVSIIKKSLPVNISVHEVSEIPKLESLGIYQEVRKPS